MNLRLKQFYFDSKIKKCIFEKRMVYPFFLKGKTKPI